MCAIATLSVLYIGYTVSIAMYVANYRLNIIIMLKIITPAPPQEFPKVLFCLASYVPILLFMFLELPCYACFINN